jgi:hypothetical protein
VALGGWAARAGSLIFAYCLGSFKVHLWRSASLEVARGFATATVLTFGLCGWELLSLNFESAA